MKNTRGYFRNKVALVTGASSGIGQELAWQLGQSGAKLTLAARRQALLEHQAERIAWTGTPRPLVANCDVTRDGEVERATVHRRGALVERPDARARRLARRDRRRDAAVEATTARGVGTSEG